MNTTFLGKGIGAGLFLWYFWYCVLYPNTGHFIDGVNLIFHEAGHAICFFMPALITAAAGSVFQILIPAVCGFYFWQRREVLSASLLSLWLAQNIVGVSLYVRDALPMQLPLLGGDSSIHDWHFILTSLDLLPYSILIADILYVVALCILIGGTGMVLYQIYTTYENA